MWHVVYYCCNLRAAANGASAIGPTITVSKYSSISNWIKFIINKALVSFTVYMPRSDFDFDYVRLFFWKTQVNTTVSIQQFCKVGNSLCQLVRSCEKNSKCFSVSSGKSSTSDKVSLWNGNFFLCHPRLSTSIDEKNYHLANTIAVISNKKMAASRSKFLWHA